MQPAQVHRTAGVLRDDNRHQDPSRPARPPCPQGYPTCFQHGCLHHRHTNSLRLPLSGWWDPG